MDRERDYEAIATWDDFNNVYIGRNTGPRREAPALCYECSREIEHPSSFDATCGDDTCRAQAAGRSQR